MPIDVTSLAPEVIEHFEAEAKGLKDKYSQVLNEKKSLQQLIDDLGGQDAVRTLQENSKKKAAEAEAARLEKMTAEDRLAEVDASYRRQIEERDNKIKSYENLMLNKEVDLKLNEALIEEGGDPLLLSHLMKGRIEAKLEDGRVHIAVKGPNGEISDEKGHAYTLKKLVQEFKADARFGAAFKVTTASGAGLRQSAGTVSTKPAVDDRSAREAYLARKYKLK